MTSPSIEKNTSSSLKLVKQKEKCIKENTRNRRVKLTAEELPSDLKTTKMIIMRGQ